MDPSSSIQFITLVILLILSAFFSSAETSLTTVNKVRIKTLAEDNNKSAILLMKVLDSPGKILSTILIGNNIANISATSLATSLTISLWGNKAVGYATGLLTILILLFGEIVPKTWATTNSEKLALVYCYPISGLMTILTPIIFIVDKLANFFLRLVGVDPNAKMNSMTESELKTYVDVSHEEGVIESEEREMILNVFDLGDSLARDIMIPRIDMCMLDINASYREVYNTFKDTMYSRIPIYEDGTDHVVGIINLKDFFLISKKSEFKVTDILRDTYYTYEYKKTDDLLVEMRKGAINLSIVLDEYGACIGLITLEDLLEEIVGEIRDEYDESEDDLIQMIEERTYLVEGSMKIDDINNAIGTLLDSDNYDSIGGIMIEMLDRLPNEGDEITLEDGSQLVATKTKNNRIEKVTLILPDKKSDANSEITPTEPSTESSNLEENLSIASDLNSDSSI